jgi:DNA polymerase-3 subunit alpha
VAKMAGSVSSRQERKSQRGNRFAFVQLSDPTGLYEVTVFSDVLDAARPHLEAGSNIRLQVEATLEADQLKLLARSIEPLDTVMAGDAGLGLRVFIDRSQGVHSIGSLFKRIAADDTQCARGPVHLCLQGDGLPGEVEVLLGQNLPVSPQIKGALRSMEGIVMVEDI